MIRVKAVSIRQALDNIIYILIILLIALICMLVIILGVHIFKAIYLESEVKEKYISVTSNNLITRILQNEFPVFCWGSVGENREYTSNESLTDDNVYEVEVELKKVEKESYFLPDKYDISILENGKIQVGNMKITNYSKLNLDLEELRKISSSQNFEHSDFLIFHTHATECYSDLENSVENYRTLDENYNVINVGKILKEELIAKGYDVMHDTTLHDYPSYNTSYQASLQTAKKYLKEHSYDFVIDLHRDALENNLSYSPKISVEGKDAAQLMFVIGTDACGLSHEKWMENLKLAIMIQNRANEMYPGLFRDLNLSSSRYNQHVAKGAFIIEVGATGNTLEEAQNAMILLANVLDSF